MAERELRGVLDRLVRLCKDSEQGFTVAAESVKNRGLKLLFKSHAAQRAQFAAELKDELKRVGGEASAGSSPLAILHRGWIHIRAALTVGDEPVEDFVLSEALRGERAAVRRYERALANELPQGIREMVERQYQSVTEVRQQVARMRGASGERLVVRLFDCGEDLDKAVEQLGTAGFDRQRIETVPLGDAVAVYDSPAGSNPTVESASAGAFGGAIVGGLIGVVAGASPLFLPQIDAMLGINGLQLFVTTVLLGMLAGILFGAAFGALIGRGAAEEDTFLTADGMQHGHALVMVQADPKRAVEASRIMRGINAARHHGWHDVETELTESRA
jgi:uncharacterized protein (TIGR02284 family)